MVQRKTIVILVHDAEQLLLSSEPSRALFVGGGHI